MRRPTWIVDTRRCTSCTDMKFDLHPSPKEPIGWKVRSLGAKLTLRSGAARQCQVLFRSRLEIVFTTGCFCTCSIGCLNFQGTSQSTALRNDWQPRTADSNTCSSISHINESLSDLYNRWTCFTKSPSTHKSAQIWVSPFDTLCGLHWAFLQSSSWEREVKMFLPQIRIRISEVNSNLEEDSKPCHSLRMTTVIRVEKLDH